MPVSRSGFPPDDAAFDESGPTKHDATDSEERSAPKREAEITVPVSFGYDLSETHIVLSLSYLYPGAVFRASLVVFMTNHHLLSFMVAWIA